MKIFIVDDDTMMTEALMDYLGSRVDAEFSVFHTGEECLEALGEKPDVIILDYYLNTVNRDAANGIEILKVIRRNAPDAHVIILSGQEHYGVALKIMKEGAEQYVMKDEKSFEKIAELIKEIV